MPRRKNTPDRRIYPLRLTRSSVTKDTKANESTFKVPGITSFTISDTKDDRYNALRLACQDVLRSFIVKGYRISFEVVLMEHVSILCFAIHDRSQNSSALSIHVPHAISLTLLSLEIARILKPCLTHFEQFCTSVTNTSRFMHECTSGNSYFCAWFQTCRSTETFASSISSSTYQVHPDSARPYVPQGRPTTNISYYPTPRQQLSTASDLSSHVTTYPSNTVSMVGTYSTTAPVVSSSHPYSAPHSAQYSARYSSNNNNNNNTACMYSQVPAYHTLPPPPPPPPAYTQQYSDSYSLSTTSAPSPSVSQPADETSEPSGSF